MARWTLFRSQPVDSHPWIELSPSTLLPTSHASRSPRRDRKRIKALLCAFFVVAAASAGLTLYSFIHPRTWRSRLVAYTYVPSPRPPLYEAWSEAEWQLPQHHVQDPFANGQKYLWVPSHVYWAGWGNFMQDLVMTAHLTYLSRRTYVFGDYTWDVDGPEYSRFNNDKWIPNRIPLSAIISGPIVGGSFPDGDATPKAVSKSYFDKICKIRRIINADEVHKTYGIGGTALQVVERWLTILRDIEDPCVEITAHPGHTLYHVFMFGDKDAVMSIWPSLSTSPMLTRLGWSDLAHHAFNVNRDLFYLTPPALSAQHTNRASCLECFGSIPPLDGLLALHIRRGDFLEHCVNLAHWGADFNGFNRFPEFPDPWHKPERAEETMLLYLQRCLPTIDQIVDKVERVRSSDVGRGLNNVYIMTNGDAHWLMELKAALRRAYPWNGIATSRDLVLTWEEKFVAQSMDMLVGERAQVFVGNGFSSLSSNVAMLRMGKGLPNDSTTMW